MITGYDHIEAAVGEAVVADEPQVKIITCCRVYATAAFVKSTLMSIKTYKESDLLYNPQNNHLLTICIIIML